MNDLDALIGSYVYSPANTSELVGLEIECEGTNLTSTVLEYWKVVEDGSLRFYEGHPPKEYVLRKPTLLSDLDCALDYLIRRLSKPDTFIYSSPRTSVHVHLNATYLTNKQVITWYCLYLILENLLSEWAGHDRVGNMFCLRTADSPANLESLMGNIQHGVVSSWVSSEHRYSACNLHSISKMGSLEFRQLSGTINKSRILQWVSILQHIKTWSYEFQDPQKIMEMFTDPDVMIEKINQSAILSPLLASRSLTEVRQELWQGLRLANELAYCISRWGWKKQKETTEDDLEEDVSDGLHGTIHCSVSINDTFRDGEEEEEEEEEDNEY